MKKILTRFRSTPEEQNAYIIERFPIHVVLEDIRSLYNVGSIFRSSDAVRVASVSLCGITGRPPRKEITKTALGAQDTVPWNAYATGVEAVQDLQSRGIKVLAVEHTDRSIPLWEADIPFPVAFVFGFEVEGVRSDTLNACDGAIEIPMFGYKGSLNVAVSCAVVLYEALRRFELLKK